MLAALVVAGSIFFNTGPFPCNGVPIVTTWTNPHPYTMQFFSARVFHGRDYGVIADYHTEVTHPGGSIMALFQNDAYGHDGHREQETNYGAGHTQELAPGESMQMFTSCQQYFGSGGNGHTVVMFFWAGKP